MNKDNKTKRVILWYTAVVCLSICLYAAIFLSPLYITLHKSSLRPYCYYIPIGVICMVLIPSLFKGVRQPKDLCRFAFFSVVCLSVAPVLLHVAMFLDDGLNEYVVSGFLFYSVLVLVYLSPVPALISIFRILFKKARLAGLWFSIAVISFVAFEMIAPKIIRFYNRTYPVLTSSWSSDNKPLKPNYSEKFGYGTDDVSSEWSKKIKAYVTDIEF